MVNYEGVDPDFDQKLSHALTVRDHLVEGTKYFFSEDYFNAATNYEMALKLEPNDRHVRYMMDESRFLTCIEDGKGAVEGIGTVAKRPTVQGVRYKV